MKAEFKIHPKYANTMSRINVFILIKTNAVNHQLSTTFFLFLKREMVVGKEQTLWHFEIKYSLTIHKKILLIFIDKNSLIKAITDIFFHFSIFTMRVVIIFWKIEKYEFYKITTTKILELLVQKANYWNLKIKLSWKSYLFCKDNFAIK